MYVFVVGQYSDTDNSWKNAFEQNTISPYISRPILETSSCRPMQLMEGTASELERLIEFFHINSNWLKMLIYVD